MNKPTIVCLCGSTRFVDEFQRQNLKLTLDGIIVLSIGYAKSDAELFKDKSEQELAEIKARLDILHYQKIVLADVILVLNVGGYVGESTRREIEFARASSKSIRYLQLIDEKGKMWDYSNDGGRVEQHDLTAYLSGKRPS